MKKLAIILGCFIPNLVFAVNVQNSNIIDSYIEQCAKEKDPIKRQNSCQFLEKKGDNQSTTSNIQKEIVTV